MTGEKLWIKIYKELHHQLCTLIFIPFTKSWKRILSCFQSNFQNFNIPASLHLLLLTLILFFFIHFLILNFEIPRRIQGLLTNNIVIEGRLRIEELEKFVNQVSAHNQVQEASLVLLYFLYLWGISFVVFILCLLSLKILWLFLFLLLLLLLSMFAYIYRYHHIVREFWQHSDYWFQM